MKTPDFASPAGAPAYLHPSSVQWQIYKNPIALGVGGVCAVLLEFADPRIRSGVWDHSIYKRDPIGRSRRTGMAALVGCYGARSQADAVIRRVNKMHAKVSGETPNGQRYRALDTPLLDWVSATAEYGFLKAYDRFVRPISPEDQARYWRDGEAVTRLYGVRNKPYSEADFMAMLDALAPNFEPHPIVDEYLEIIQSGRAAPAVPRVLHTALARAAVSLLPGSVRSTLRLTEGYELRRRDELMLRTVGRILDTYAPPNAPQCQASVRMGLPASFLYRSPRKRAQLLRELEA